MAMEKTFDATEAEPRLYARWEEAGAFRAGKHVENGESRAFTVMIPPPNVTGALHVGHAFNNTLQDILTRWHRMRGFDVLWQPGQDHAGIATQLQVEKMLAATQQPSRRELGREAFLARVWEWKAQYGSTIINQLKRLGSSCDWSRNAFTMSGAPGAPAGEEGNFHDAVLKVFVDLYDKGLITRGKRLVNWDPHFETAISDLEVENIETAGHMWHFKYPLAGGQSYEYVERDAEGNETLRETRDYISIATTRPETMLGDGAVAVHPSDARYAPIVGMLCEIPVGPKEHRRLIPIITDEYPDPAFGSGAVKITGAHDFNDYAVAQRNGIPMYRLMDTAGRMRADGAPYEEAAEAAGFYSRSWLIRKGYLNPGFAEQPVLPSEAEADALNLVPEDYRGLDRFEARKKVVADIDAEGLMIMVEDKPIMQPFGDRSKVVIEPMLTDQWFVDAKELAKAPLQSVRSGAVKILPESGEKTFYHWMENIEPWCISRQLWWGHQVPVWYGLDLGAPDFTDDEGDGDLDQVELGRLLSEGGMLHRDDVTVCAADFATVAARFMDANADIPAPLSHARIVEVENKPEAIRLFAESLAAYNVTQDMTKLVYPVWRDPDVLDTWFSSGMWPFGTLGWPEATPELARHFPGDVLITGQDILFFWVARMMMMSQAVLGKDPFHTVYLHQLVRDEKGKKMSKTTGNVIDPLEMIDEFGADALRFTNASMAAIGGVLKLSTDRIKGYRNFGTKLWNACRFAEMNGVFTAPDGLPAPQETVNRWILGELGRVREEVDAAIETWRFNDAANALYAFVWGKVCDWYVEFSKPLLLDGTEALKAETQATMKFVLQESLKLLHPFMPFITEELWGETGGKGLLMVTEWPTCTAAGLIDAEADEEMTLAIALIEGIRSARAQMNVPAGLYVPLLQVEASDAVRAAWAKNETLIKRLARVADLTEAAELPKGALTVAIKGGAFAMPLADIIDVAAEKARLGKVIDRLGKEIGALKGRLGNAGFVASAPEEVVAEARENLATREGELAQLQAALARLNEIG